VLRISKKVCLLGDFAVGKTSLVRRLVYDRFDDRYLSTIGVKVSRKAVAVSGDRGPVDVNMMLWDLAGSEEFTRMRASYLRGAAGAVLVCDVTRLETLEDLAGYVLNLREVSPGAEIVLAANKVDLVDDHHELLERLDEVALALGARYYLTSALTGDQVEVLFRDFAVLLLSSDKSARL